MTTPIVTGPLIWVATNGSWNQAKTATLAAASSSHSRDGDRCSKIAWVNQIDAVIATTSAPASTGAS